MYIDAHSMYRLYALSSVIVIPCSIDRGGVWLRTPANEDSGPALFKGSFTIDGTPKDTFIDMQVHNTNRQRVYIGKGNEGIQHASQHEWTLDHIIMYVVLIQLL